MATVPGMTQREVAQQVVKLRHPGTWVATAIVLLIVGLVAISVATNPAFEWPVVAQYMLDGEVLAGLRRTLALTVAAMVMGLVLGTVLALLRLSRNWLLSTLSWAYIWFFRSVPVLVQLIFWYNFGALYATISSCLLRHKRRPCCDICTEHSDDE